MQKMNRPKPAGIEHVRDWKPIPEATEKLVKSGRQIGVETVQMRVFTGGALAK